MEREPTPEEKEQMQKTTEMGKTFNNFGISDELLEKYGDTQEKVMSVIVLRRQQEFQTLPGLAMFLIFSESKIIPKH